MYILAGEAGAAINEILLENNIVGLGFGESGFREITNNKQPITKLDDLKVMKIGALGMKMYVDLFKSLGADPISMNFAEVFTSLQQGAIDGQENPFDVIDSNQINTVQKFMSMWDYSYDMIILGFNKTKFESLSPEDQKIIRSAAKDAMAYQRQLVRELAKEQLEKFEQGSMQITELKDIDIESFKTAVEPLYQGYENQNYVLP